METYEYEVVPTGLLTDRDIDQAAWLELGVGLDAWGKAGWELLSVGYNDRGLPVTWVFRRALTAAPVDLTPLP